MLGGLFKRAASCLYSLTWAPTTRDTNTLVRVLSSDFVQQSPSWPAPAPLGWKVLPKTWRNAVDTRAGAYSVRKYLMQERLFRGAWQLPPLQTGDQLWVLDQHGYSPRQWSKTEVVDEADWFDSYLVPVVQYQSTLLLPQCQLSWSRDQEISTATHSRSHPSLYLRMVTKWESIC